MGVSLSNFIRCNSSQVTSDYLPTRISMTSVVNSRSVSLMFFLVRSSNLMAFHSYQCSIASNCGCYRTYEMHTRRYSASNIDSDVVTCCDRTQLNKATIELHNQRSSMPAQSLVNRWMDSNELTASRNVESLFWSYLVTTDRLAAALQEIHQNAMRK